MADDLPREFDAIVLGTGMTESIIAAALARIGHTVLHLDRNDYYGGDWATFNFDGFQNFVDQHKVGYENNPNVGETEVMEISEEENERLLFMSTNSYAISGLQVYSYLRADEPEPEILEEINNAVASTEPSEVAIEEGNLESSDETKDQTDRPITAAVKEEESEVKNEPEEHVAMEMDQPSVAMEIDQPSKSSEVEEENKQSGEEAAEKPQKASEHEKKVEEKPKHLGRKRWSLASVKKEWRRFNIDLAPKVLFARGSLVELLISSNVSRYTEFRSVSRILTILNGKIEQVPCSRSDVFSSKYVSMLEKRLLMKFTEFCLDYENRPLEYEGFQNRTFLEFLQSRRLTPNLQHFVLHSIAMVAEDTPTLEGLKATRQFLHSHGRFGNTPFLWPIYGSGELPQCFCRMCAVFGGVYCLRKSIQAMAINKEDNRCTAVVDTEGRRYSCRWLISARNYFPVQMQDSLPSVRVSRAILLTDRSLKPDKVDQVSLITIPPMAGSSNPITAIELDHSTHACPKDMYMVHMTCTASGGTAQEDLYPAVATLFQNVNSPEEREDDDETAADEKPRVLWCLYFNTQETVGSINGLPSNVYACDGPGRSLGFEHSVRQAKELYRCMCPDQEFLPTPPDPEDIIYVEEDKPENPGSEEAGSGHGDSEQPENDDAGHEAGSGQGDVGQEDELNGAGPALAESASSELKVGDGDDGGDKENGESEVSAACNEHKDDI